MKTIFIGCLFLIFGSSVTPNSAPLSLLSPFFGGLLTLRGSKEIKPSSSAFVKTEKYARGFLLLLLFIVFWNITGLSDLSALAFKITGWGISLAAVFCQGGILFTAAEGIEKQARQPFLPSSRKKSSLFAKMTSASLVPAALFSSLKGPDILWRLLVFVFGTVYLFFFRQRIQYFEKNA